MKVAKGWGIQHRTIPVNNAAHYLVATFKNRPHNLTGLFVFVHEVANAIVGESDSCLCETPLATNSNLVSAESC